MKVYQTRKQKLHRIYNQFAEKPVSKSVSCDQGWDSILLSLHDDLIAIDPSYTIIQIKEKFGGLRYYVSHKHTGSCELGVAPNSYGCKFNTRISEAEIESYLTCETCGEPGKLRSGGWVRTLCEIHAEGKEVNIDLLSDGFYDEVE